MRINRLGTGLGLVALVFCVRCNSGDDSEHAVASACEQLRDHLVDVQLADAAGVDRASHAAALRSSLGADFLDRCTTLSSDEVRCAMTATTVADASACAEGTP